MHHLEHALFAFTLCCLTACSSDDDTTSTAAHPSTANTSTTALAYVGFFGDNALGVVDVASGKVRTTIPVTAPDGIAITPDGKKVYVSSNDSGTVAVIDTKTERVATSIPVGTQPSGMVATSDGKYVIVAVQGDGEAAIIDTATDSVTTHAAVGKAHSAATNPDGSLAFVTSQAADAPAVQVVDIPSAAPAATFPVDAAPRALCDVQGKLYVTLVGSSDVQVLDAASGQKLGMITTQGSPHDVRPTLDLAEVLTVSQTAGELDFIDPQTSTIAAQVATGTMPHWIALSRDGAAAYVTNEGDNNLVVVDLKARAVTKTIAVGKAPRKIVMHP
jgi:YVTN family beta-propeller protein